MNLRETERVQHLIDTAHQVVARYYAEHPDGPLASLIGDLDIAATTVEVVNAEDRKEAP